MLNAHKISWNNMGKFTADLKQQIYYNLYINIFYRALMESRLIKILNTIIW